MKRSRAFTLIELMIAITILALVLTAIFSTWTAILRASKVGKEAAATVQRSRIALRMIEDSLGSAQSFAQNRQFYGFVVENGSEANLSFVARLAKSFPRSGRFGDQDVRRLTFSVGPAPEGDRQLVLRQNPLLMEMDVDEKEHPLVLAKHVKEFAIELYDKDERKWVEEWPEAKTNQLPKLVKVTLKLADNNYSSIVHEEITRLVSLPAMTVPPGWQTPVLVPGAQRQGTNTTRLNPKPR